MMRTAVRLLDERDAFGGRAKAALFLVHPGPSLLVTVVVLASAGLAERSTPGPLTLLRIALIVLPAQLAIGAANDLADVRADRVAKPHKPLVRGVVPVGLPVAIVGVGALTCLASAASIGWAAFGIGVLGLGAGLGYDAGLKRHPTSWLTWWAGLVAVPLGGYAGVGRLSRSLLWTIALAGLLSLSLHSANALPDLDPDRDAGVDSLPVRLGARRARAVMLVAPLLAAALVAALAQPLGQGVVGPAVAAAALLIGTTAALLLPGAAFIVLAPVIAVATVAWLAALPGSP